MPEKLKLTKNQLKKERDSLKLFQRYLPMLQLKKQQLQLELIKVRKRIEAQEMKRQEEEESISRWISVFSQQDLAGWLKVQIKSASGNIAGVDIPVFQGVDISQQDYDFISTPLWVDAALDKAKKILSLKAELKVLRTQEVLLKEELRIATQRVNLFEKVMIPRAQNHIRIIRIFLGDMQTAEVVRGKIAKAKTAARREAAKL